MGVVDNFKNAQEAKARIAEEAREKSRLEGAVGEGTPKNGTVAGMAVSQTEVERKNKKVIINTSIRIDKELKDQAMALAAVKQISFTQLIELGLKNMLRRNADLMNKFTKFKIDETSEI